MEEKKEEDEDQQNSQKHLECLSDVSWKPFGGLLGRLGGILAVQGGSWAFWVPQGGLWGPHVPDSSLPPSPPLLAKLLKFSQLETNVEESSLSSYSRRSTYVYMEEVEARTQKCRRPPTSRLGLFRGAAGDRVAEWRPGARRGLSFEWAPVSASGRASFVPHFFIAASRRRVVCTRVATQN